MPDNTDLQQVWFGPISWLHRHDVMGIPSFEDFYYFIPKNVKVETSAFCIQCKYEPEPVAHYLCLKIGEKIKFKL